MVDIEYLKTRYFYLDEPVKYKLKDNEINIYPIQLKDSEFFLSSIGILTVDKNYFIEKLKRNSYFTIGYCSFFNSVTSKLRVINL